MDWTEITADLTTATSAAVNELLSTGTEDTYAIALVVAEDGMGLGLAWTTLSHFEEHLADEAQAQSLTPADEAYYRWAPAEWQHESWGDELFADVNDVVSEEALDDGLDKADFKRLTEAMTAALFALRQSHRQALATVTLFVTITDSDRAEALENRSAKALNPPELTQAFLNRYAG